MLCSFYGASECGGITYDQTGTAAERGSVGPPLPGVDARIDPDTQLLQIRSRAVATGYLPVGDDALHEGYYQTQDQACWKDGELVLLGRKGSLINIGGHKVDPRRVEKVIRGLPGVSEVLVLPIEGRVGGSLTCCAVVASPDQSVTRKDVLAECQNRLVHYERPRQILVLPELPRTTRGKVSTETIRSLIANNP